jgi:hypothetical protein
MRDLELVARGVWGYRYVEGWEHALREISRMFLGSEVGDSLGGSSWTFLECMCLVANDLHG